MFKSETQRGLLFSPKNLGGNLQTLKTLKNNVSL
jgi:hypothetical protein